MFIILFLLALSVLVIIHELGHYLAARLCGVKAEEFGFGFPPRLIGFVKERGCWKIVGPRDHAKYANTVLSLNWLPLGGFVRIKGEQTEGMHEPDSIHAKPIWQRVFIISAGVIMNWLLAALIFTSLLALGTTALLEALPPGAHISERTILISEILPSSPAAQAGIKPGDELLSIQGVKLTVAREARDIIRQQEAQPMSIIIRREHQAQTFQVVPVKLKEISRFGIGVAMADAGKVKFPLPFAILNGVKMTAELTQAIIVSLAGVLRDLFVTRTVTPDLSGPIGIAVIANRIAQQGIAPLLQFVAVLSVNLAVINFLPIPALDGGRVLFLAIEKIRRRPISRTLEIGMHNVAFLILVLIILLVTARDVSRLFHPF